MKRIFAVTAALVALSAPDASLLAQAAPPVVGAWEIEYARGQRVGPDGTENIMGKGKLTIVQSGDTLIATLDLGPRPDGTPSPKTSVGGRVSGDNAVFVQKQQVTLNINGEMQQADATVTWTLQAAGDALSGTIAREIPMMGNSASPSPVKGTRLKS
jgi:hypothetical protein